MSRKGIIIGALSLVVIGVIGGGIEFFYGNGWGTPISLGSANGQANVGSQITMVDIEVPSADVTVTGTGSNVLTYTGELPANTKSQDKANQLVRSELIVQRTGNTLKVTFDEPRSTLGLGLLKATPYLNIQLPSSVKTLVTTNNGSVNVSQMTADCTIHATNGAVKLNALQGNVMVTDTNGAIDGTSSVNGAWTMKTTNGAITLDVPSSTSAKLQAATTNGAIGGDVNWLFDKQHHGVATLGRGLHEVQLETTNGAVSVNLH